MAYKIYAFLDDKWVELNDDNSKINGLTISQFKMKMSPIRIDRFEIQDIIDHPFLNIEFNNKTIHISHLFIKYEKI